MAKVKANIAELKHIASAPSDNRIKTRNIIDLYEERKIASYKAAINS